MSNGIELFFNYLKGLFQPLCILSRGMRGGEMLKAEKKHCAVIEQNGVSSVESCARGIFFFQKEQGEGRIDLYWVIFVLCLSPPHEEIKLGI